MIGIFNGIYNHRTWDVDQETWWANEWANEWEKVESINLDAFDHDLIVIRHWNDGIVWGIIPSHGLISVIFRLVNHDNSARY